jgi:hypothetical protein
MKKGITFSSFVLRCAVAAGLILSWSGCSNKKKEDWYDQSQQESQREDNFIAEQQGFGVSEKDARESYTRWLFTVRTEGKDSAIVREGEELKQNVTEPE